MNGHAAYIEETFEGGLEAYVSNQQKRYAEAIASGDTDLISRLTADAQRVGYTLSAPRSGGGGGASTGAGAGRGVYYDNTGQQVVTSVSGQLSNLVSGLSGYLGYIIAAIAVFLGIKIIS